MRRSYEMGFETAHPQDTCTKTTSLVLAFTPRWEKIAQKMRYYRKKWLLEPFHLSAFPQCKTTNMCISSDDQVRYLSIVFTEVDL